MDQAGHHVDYSRLRESDAYVQFSQELTPRLRYLDLDTLDTRNARLAFWINLYNVLVINAVIAFGVKRSVTEGRLGLLAFFRRAAYDIGGQRFSLEGIEHGILRANRGIPYAPGPQFGPSDLRQRWIIAPVDPRVHFALNCASKSCPPVGVYDADKIDAQLDMAARNFIANEVIVDPARCEVRLSHLFRWYAPDFGGRSGVIAFLSRYLPEDEARDWLQTGADTRRLIFQPYNWSLNVAQIGKTL